MVLTNEVREASPQELVEAFDHSAMYYVGMSGEEFLRRLDAGELQLDDDRVRKVLRHLDFVRPGSGIFSSCS
jgi:hypothetical protein